MMHTFLQYAAITGGCVLGALIVVAIVVVVALFARAFNNGDSPFQ
jgi:hypothetical protein